MPNNNNKLSQFDFNALQEDFISQLKSGQSLTGRDGRNTRIGFIGREFINL